MRGCNRSTSPRRSGARAVRAVLVAVIAVVALVATPGTAAAGGTVKPTLDCLRKNTDGTYTAVLGYTNTSNGPVTIPVGVWNQMSPAKYHGPQPTTFQPGVQRGAHSVTITASEYMGGPYWYLDGTFVFFGWSWASGVPTCPASTPLPEEGNGTGPLIALGIAGVVGAMVVRRRARAATAEAPGAVPADA